MDKLLTGFDAPPATYLYIDKQMQDHGLFQAICRVNRLDSEDKEYGYIIDYKDLFKSLAQSIKDYTGEAFAGFDAADVEGLLKDRLQQGWAKLEEARESVKALCEPVEAPRDTAAYLQYFCAAESGNVEELKSNESKRVTLYRLVAALLRAYANLANEMNESGYSESDAREIRAEADYYEKERQEVKLASGDYIDLKMYEPAMRHLLDTYIRAEDSEQLSAFDDVTLMQLIVERGNAAVDALPEGIRKNREAVAETIENNVRRLIIDETAVNPKYYEKMSEPLDALILRRKEEVVDYKEYLATIVDLTRKVKRPDLQVSYPPSLDSVALRALFDNLGELADATAPDQDVSISAWRETKALAIDNSIRNVKKADWRGNRLKEREVRNAIKAELGDDETFIDAIFEMVKAQSDY